MSPSTLSLAAAWSGLYMPSATVTMVVPGAEGRGIKAHARYSGAWGRGQERQAMRRLACAGRSCCAASETVHCKSDGPRAVHSICHCLLEHSHPTRP